MFIAGLIITILLLAGFIISMRTKCVRIEKKEPMN